MEPRRTPKQTNMVTLLSKWRISKRNLSRFIAFPLNLKQWRGRFVPVMERQKH